MGDTMLETVVAMSIGKCRTLGGQPTWCDQHSAFQPLLTDHCVHFARQVDFAADILRTFANHDISGITPYSDIANRWYHDGIHAAQEVAGGWADED